MKEKEREQIKIRDIMIEDVAYVTVPGTREEVMVICKERYISGVPVVKEGKVVGVVTRQDLLRKPDEGQIALLMSRNPITISPDATIIEAAGVILSHGIRRLPVVKEQKLVGIITVADIVREIAELGYKEPIGDYIGNKTMTIWDGMPLSVAGRIMELARAKAVPVLSSERELVGLITDRDLINAAVIEDATEDSDLSLGSDEDEWTWEGMRDTMRLYYSVSKIKLPDKLVREIMVKEVVTATRNCEVSECAGKMSKNRFDQLPVISTRGKLTGILLDRNLLKVLV
ncbi:MAG: CBS domain-containing protein [Methanophagales archaeon]|nr:CBS domain-containing protein [Methanophagales archaeon]